MNKKRVASLLLAGIMAMSLGLGTYAAVDEHAEALNGTDTKRTAGSSAYDAEEAASVSITKNLYMDASAATPNKTFTFTVTPKAINPDTDNTAYTTSPAANMPTLGTAVSGVTNGSGTFTAATASTVLEGSTQATTYTNKTIESTDAVAADFTTDSTGKETKVVTVTTSDLLAGVTWQHAGEYVYEIVETEDDPLDPTLSYSKAVYQMHVYVANKYANEDKTNYEGATQATTTSTTQDADGLYVAAVGVFQTKKDNGDANGDKVDANDGKGVTGNGSQFAFGNVYTPLSDLRIQKKVAGAYGDRTLPFAFAVGLQLPATATYQADDTFTAYLCNAEGTPIDKDAPITFTCDADGALTTDTEIKLTDGQFLQFGVYKDDAFTKDGVLPVGTSYTVKETTVTGYTATAAVNYMNAAQTLTAMDDEVVNTGSVTSAGMKVGDATADTEIASFLTDNQTIVTNTYDAVTPTGILIDNLPAILLIALAIGGLVVYVILKKRGRAR